jgi:hypothetical protein
VRPTSNIFVIVSVLSLTACNDECRWVTLQLTQSCTLNSSLAKTRRCEYDCFCWRHRNSLPVSTTQTMCGPLQSRSYRPGFFGKPGKWETRWYVKISVRVVTHLLMNCPSGVPLSRLTRSPACKLDYTCEPQPSMLTGLLVNLNRRLFFICSC